jgi:hypothetical protein
MFGGPEWKLDDAEAGIFATPRTLADSMSDGISEDEREKLEAVVALVAEIEADEAA